MCIHDPVRDRHGELRLVNQREELREVAGRRRKHRSERPLAGRRVAMAEERTHGDEYRIGVRLGPAHRVPRMPLREQARVDGRIRPPIELVQVCQRLRDRGALTGLDDVLEVHDNDIPGLTPKAAAQERLGERGFPELEEAPCHHHAHRLRHVVRPRDWVMIGLAAQPVNELDDVPALEKQPGEASRRLVPPIEGRFQDLRGQLRIAKLNHIRRETRVGADHLDGATAELGELGLVTDAQRHGHASAVLGAACRQRARGGVDCDRRVEREQRHDCVLSTVVLVVRHLAGDELRQPLGEPAAPPGHGLGEQTVPLGIQEEGLAEDRKQPLIRHMEAAREREAPLEDLPLVRHREDRQGRIEIDNLDAVPQHLEKLSRDLLAALAEQIDQCAREARSRASGEQFVAHSVADGR